MPRPIIEPFRIKVVEPIRMTGALERRAILEKARFDLFGVRAADVIVDLLADSGTGLAEKIRVDLIRTEGFVTYGGLAGRDLEAIAQGLHEVLDEDYLAYRFAASAYLARSLEKAGLPVVKPAAAHAVYLDAGAALPHLAPDDLPGQSLACAFYLAGGVRICEIGNLMFGSGDKRRQLVRFAEPRRVYTQSHVDYVGAGDADRAATAFLAALQRGAVAGVGVPGFLIDAQGSMLHCVWKLTQASLRLALLGLGSVWQPWVTQSMQFGVAGCVVSQRP